MTGSRVRLWCRPLLLAVVPVLAACGEPLREPLRRLCSASDLVVTARVLESGGPDGPELQVQDVLLAPAPPARVAPGDRLRLRADDGSVVDGDLVLAFLVARPSGRFAETVPGAGLRVDGAAEPAGLAAVRAWQAVAPRTGAERRAAEVAWTLDLLRDPDTAWDAVIDLMQTSPLPRTGPFWDHAPDALDFDLLGAMTEEQVGRVVEALCAPDHDVHVRGRLALVLAGRDDPRILPCLLEQLRAIAEGGAGAAAQFPGERFPDNLFWDAHEHMEAILARLQQRDGAVDEELWRLRRRYEALPYGDDRGLPLLRAFTARLPRG